MALALRSGEPGMVTGGPRKDPVVPLVRCAGGPRCCRPSRPSKALVSSALLPTEFPPEVSRAPFPPGTRTGPWPPALTLFLTSQRVLGSPQDPEPEGLPLGAHVGLSYSSPSFLVGAGPRLSGWLERPPGEGEQRGAPPPAGTVTPPKCRAHFPATAPSLSF